MEEFRKIQDAFEMLVSKIEDDEAAAKYTNMNYTCHIRKGVPGVGFGMVVVEEPRTGHVIIKTVLPKMQLIYLSAAARGKMLENDRLLLIDEDDVSTWSLARVVQRLNDFRVSPGVTVELTFMRRVLKEDVTIPTEGFPEEDEDDVQLSENTEVTHISLKVFMCTNTSYTITFIFVQALRMIEYVIFFIILSSAEDSHRR